MKKQRNIPHVHKEERSQIHEGVERDGKDCWFKRRILNPIYNNVNWKSFFLISGILIILSFFEPETTLLEVLGILLIFIFSATLLGEVEKKRHTRSS